ncbi:fumarylacetoacetate hydrolase family protein [Microcella sp.]|uniref:fumarylacetoacetate hydrolase family protein n=1 Tax=Microcella sp. TaxID=1913979 RepID=UPI003F6FF23B
MERADGSVTSVLETEGGLLPLNAPNLDRLLCDPRAGFSPTAPALTDVTRFLCPVLAPAKVICVGLNYRTHILEMGHDLPQYPTIFLKHADTLIGPTADIELPPVSDRIDWEGELVVVVGRELHRADQQHAAAAIAGYTIANDVSLRDWQYRSTQWQQGKMFDATTPLGPVIVTADEFDPRDGQLLRTRVNGEIVQEAPVSDLVFDAAHLLSYISHITRLRPGDLVLTGTPGGVGAGRQPQVYLADGDFVEVEVEGIGRLRNRLRITPLSPQTTGAAYGAR